MADTAEPAVGAGDDVLAAGDAGVADEALGYQLGVLDEVGEVREDAGDEDLAVGQRRALENLPLVLVARVGGFDGQAVGVDLVEDVDDVLQRNVAGVRADPAAPAGVQANTVVRGAAEGVVYRLDAHLGVGLVLGHAHVGELLPGHGQVGIVDLEAEAGLDYGLVLGANGLGQGEQEVLLSLVVGVDRDLRQGAGARGGQESFLVLHTFERRAEVIELDLQLGPAGVAQGRDAGQPLRVQASAAAEQGVAALFVVGPEVVRVAQHGRPRRLGLPLDGPPFVAGYTARDVAVEVLLPEFAVVDDVDSAVGLFADDFRDGLTELTSKGGVIWGRSPEAASAWRSHSGCSRAPAWVVRMRSRLRFTLAGAY